MTLAILELLEQHEHLDRAAVDTFLAAHSSPIVEGSTVTFLWRGRADEVFLRHFIFGLQSAQAFRRLGGTDLWYCPLEVPAGSRLEYKIEVVERGRRRLVRDPMNPLIARDPFGANSVCHAVGYEIPEWTGPDPESRPGTREEIEIPPGVYREARPVTVWLPPRMRTTRRYPLLVVFDGRDYLEYARMTTVLENLVYRNEVASVIVAFCQSPDRMTDYAAHPDHARWLVQDLVPALEARYPVRPDGADRALMGASLGAVAALHASWLHPGAFGRLLLQSGSFAFTDIGRDVRHPVLEPVRDFVNALRARPVLSAKRVFVSCGVYEGLIYENRSLVPVLQRTGTQLRYEEAKDGHNWEAWRDRLRDGLTWLFPGPLALVYE